MAVCPTPETEEPGPGDPARLGAYHLLGRLGEGGQGTVRLGRSPRGEKVAIKVLHLRIGRNEEARGRFRREVAAARRVAEFTTARVLDVDVAGGTPYVVSEYVAGPSLDELVKRDGPRRDGGLRRLAIGTAAALAAIHRAGIVHRDFKPANVLLGPDGPRVIDFGIARLLDTATTKSGGVRGTPAYLSPEQIEGEPITAASDLFSWASTMVFAATGRPPFGEDTLAAVFHRILTAVPDLSGVPETMRPLIEACLRRDPADRPAARDLLLALIDHDAPAAAGPERGAPPVPPPPAAADSGPATRPIPVTRPGPGAVRPPGPVPPAGDTGPSAPARRRPYALLAAGGLAEQGSTVRLIVSKGVEPVSVPGVLGMSAEDARTTLEAAGFKVRVKYGRASGAPVGQVRRTDPAEGERVPPDSTVTVYLPPPAVRVPKVAGQRMVIAVGALEEAGLKTKTVFRSSATVPAGYVIDVSPEAGSDVRPGVTVTLLVSTGPARSAPQPDDVPDDEPFESDESSTGESDDADSPFRTFG